MSYNFFDTGGARASNVLSPDLLSQALGAYDANQRRPSALEADIARNMQATREAQLAEQDARMMQQYHPMSQQATQQPMQQQYEQPMQPAGQQPMQYDINPQGSPQQMSDYFQDGGYQSQEPMQQQTMQGPMQQQPSGQPPLDVALRMSKARGINPQIIEKNGQSYYTTMFGEYPIGPAAPTAFQKGLNDLSIKAIGDIDAKYAAVSESLSEARSMVELSRAPEFDEAFSSAPGRFSRSVVNWYTENFGDTPVADVRTQFINKADKLVMSMMGDVKGSLTNKELSFLQRQKPNANDSPREIRSKLDNIMTTYSLAKQRMSVKRKLIEQGYSPIEASQIAEEMISRDDISRESKEAVYGKESAPANRNPMRNESRAAPTLENMISNEVSRQGSPEVMASNEGGEEPDGPKGGAPQAGEMSFSDKRNAIENALRVASGPAGGPGNTWINMIGDSLYGLVVGGLQGAENLAVSTANAPIDTVNYLAGINHPRIKKTSWADPNTESTAQRYGQNIGQFAAETGIPMALGGNAVGAAKKIADARNIGPLLSAALQTGAGAVAGGLEGALFNEDNRAMGAAVGTTLGTLGGLASGGMDYVNRVGKSKVAKSIAAEAMEAQRIYGDRINDVINSAESMGADKGLKSVKIPEMIGREFSNEIHAVKGFNKNKTIESGQKALSNVGDVIRKLESSGAKPGSLGAEKLEKAINLQASLRASIGNALERANVPGGADALFDALSQYRENVIPLTKNPAISAYMKSKKTAVDAKKMVEAVLKDDKAMEMLMKSHPELRNIKNIRIGSDLLGNAMKVGAVGSGLGIAGKTALDIIGDQ